jgi:CheY-like chemotaxis protein
LARKILLADDSVTAQNMGRKILSDAGYDVVTVNNGSAALKRVAETKPDLIVLDVYMPGYSGLEVCQRLKDAPDTEDIPVLLTVGKLEPFKPEEARRVRADSYIVKPFEASELLTALARMEDRMIPGKDGSRKKSETDNDPDTGWKNRLRFPSKKKKEEAESEADVDFATGPSFRNFRRGKGKASAGKAPAPVEPSVVPDIPRDITPEELDALSALAAKLDGPAATGERVAQAAEQAPSVETKAEFEVAAPVAEEKTQGEAVVEPGEPQAASEPPAPIAVSETNAARVAPEPGAGSEGKPAEPVEVETFAVAAPPLGERTDEPVFATAASAVEPVAHEQQPEVKEVTAVSSETAAAASPSPTVEIQAGPEEAKVEVVPQVVEGAATAEALAEVPQKIEETPQMTEVVPVVAAAEEAETGPAPSEEELAEALRLLTPALGHAESSPMPTQETLAAAGAALAEEAARNASEAPRWVAAGVAVSPEEAALSLEAEMFRTLAGTPAGGESPAPSATVAINPVAESETATEPKAEVPAEAPAEMATTVPVAAGEVAALPVEAVQAEQQSSAAKVAEEATEEPAPATFANAVQHNEIEAVSAQAGTAPVVDTAAPAEQAGPPVVETAEGVTSEAAGDEEAMAKKSNWHQIRTGSAAAASTDVVEAAKQAEPEAPKAMAAAAAAESSPAPTPDSSAIASIVDSVLADLRPKIVEEIAKKLAGK